MSNLTKNLMIAPIERVSDYGLPATARFLALQGSDGIQTLIIIYDGAHTDFPATVPNGSLHIRPSGAGAANIGIKAGTIGLTNGTWKTQAVNT